MGQQEPESSPKVPVEVQVEPKKHSQKWSHWPPYDMYWISSLWNCNKSESEEELEELEEEEEEDMSKAGVKIIYLQRFKMGVEWSFWCFTFIFRE